MTFFAIETLTKILYLIAAIFFIYGIKKMGHPESARKGNVISIVGMMIGILVVLFFPVQENGIAVHESREINFLIFFIIFSCLFIGGGIGYFSAMKVKLTAMPEMVSLFNGFGGSCSMLIGFGEMVNFFSVAETSISKVLISIAAIFIGSITFSGSIVAWAKLSGFLSGFGKSKFNFFKPVLLRVVSFLLLFFILLLAFFIIKGEFQSIEFHTLHLLMLFLVISILYGFFFVAPIGGGDMPVIISLLNSLSGIAACISGFLYDNQFIIIGGILVGASGVILTILMCQAMNRSLLNVIFGSFGSKQSRQQVQKNQNCQEINLSDLAMQLKYAQKVIIVPGYGLAVAQAQHVCNEIEKLLEESGVQVSYAIHPVAGRMPGHMNVLLAEAQISYDKLIELQQANEQFPDTDVVMVIGANDVVNPDAKENSSSPIFGMPVLEVKLAKKIVILKRSMASGYAGIDNPLFYQENSAMLFGDAKKSLEELKSAIREV